MTVDEAAQVFSVLAPIEQVKCLALFAHNLTIAARDTYEFQAPGVRAPERLRAVNEIQHRVLQHIHSLLTASEWRYPDEVLLSIMLAEENSDGHLREQANWAFQDAMKKSNVLRGA
jgi:hypothetical protein